MFVFFCAVLIALSLMISLKYIKTTNGDVELYCRDFPKYFDTMNKNYS